jgi:hypothetical protein
VGGSRNAEVGMRKVEKKRRWEVERVRNWEGEKMGGV